MLGYKQMSFPDADVTFGLVTVLSSSRHFKSETVLRFECSSNVLSVPLFDLSFWQVAKFRPRDDVKASNMMPQ